MKILPKGLDSSIFYLSRDAPGTPSVLEEWFVNVKFLRKRISID